MNKYQAAINRLKRLREVFTYGEYENDIKVLEELVANSTMYKNASANIKELQPNKVHVRLLNQYVGHCESCNNIVYRRDVYCSLCGGEIDEWNENT